MGLRWNKIKINEIRKEAHKYLFKEFNGANISNPKTVYIYYYIIPIFISGLLCAFEVKINNDSSTYLITGISIFAGLFFNLLLVVADKMTKRKKLLNSRKEDISHYAKLYKNFSEQLIAYISYAIILSLSLIVLMFLTQVDFAKIILVSSFKHIDCIQIILNNLFNFLVFYFGYQFLTILLIILSNMYVMLIDDINLSE